MQALHQTAAKLRKAIESARLSWVFAAAFLLSAAVLALRFPDRLSDPRPRVEDGVILFGECALHGIRTFLMPYSGYLNTVQRGIAYLGSWFHPVWTPWVYNWASLAITAAVCARIAVAGIPLGWRMTFALIFLLHPCFDWQALHATNIIWFTAALLPVFAVERAPATLAGKTLTIGATAIVGLSGPFAIVFAPLFLGRLFLLGRKRYDILIALTAFASAVVQASIFLSSRRIDKLAGERVLPDLSDAWLLANRFIINFLFGHYRNETSLVQSAVAIGILGLFAAGSIAALVAGSIARKDAARVVLLLLGAALAYAAGIAGSHELWVSSEPFGEGQRYYILPYLLVAWAVLALTCVPHRRWTRLPAAIIMIAATLIAFRGNQYGSSTWVEDVRRIERDGFGMLRVHPYGSFQHTFHARGSGRHGFATSDELQVILDRFNLFYNVFGIRYMTAISGRAYYAIFPERVGERIGLLMYPDLFVRLQVPPGATAIRGAYGFSSIAAPPNSLDRMAGGDGFHVKISLTGANDEVHELHADAVKPVPVTDPPSLSAFHLLFPPGNWTSLTIDIRPGGSGQFDFTLWTDLAFEVE